MYDYTLSSEWMPFGARILGEFLIYRLRKGGTWRATNAELRDLSGLGETTIMRALKFLKHHDLISVEHCPATQIKILSLGPNGWAEVDSKKQLKNG